MDPSTPPELRSMETCPAGDDPTAVALLRGLVEIPSLSRHEAAAVDWLVDAFRQLGYGHAFRDGAGNAVGIRECPSPQGNITETGILLGHIDTVPGEIPVRFDGDRLYGRGSVDAKGSLAAFVVAVARAQPQPGQRWIVVGAVEEECPTSAGARFVAEQFQPDWCIIGEPSGATAVTLGYKGRLQILADWVQASAHSAGPRTAVAERGVAWWLRLRLWAEHWNQSRTKLFEQLQVSLEEFVTSSDGLQDRARLRASLRLPVDFPLTEFSAEFGPGVRTVCDDGEFSCEIQHVGLELAHQEPRTSPLVQRFNRVFRQAGWAPRHKLKTGTSDMNVVAPRWQCPIIAYGPGDSSLDHTPHEHLEISEYLSAIRILQAVLEHPGFSPPG